MTDKPLLNHVILCSVTEADAPGARHQEPHEPWFKNPGRNVAGSLFPGTKAV